MLIILFLLILSPLSAGDLYDSDGLGRKGEPVEEISDRLWVIEDRGDERILYKEGELYKRWKYSTLQENGRSLYREEYYFGTELRTVSISDAGGRLIRESLYDSEGEFMVENRFSYEGNRVLSISQFDRQGEKLKEQSFSYRADGSLKSLKAGEHERTDWRAASFSESFLDAFYLEEGRKSLVSAYEEGRLKYRREHQDDTLIRQSEYLYTGDGSLEKEIIHDFSDESRTIRYFDKNGNMVVQNFYRNDTLIRTESNTYSNGLLKVRREQTEESRMRLEYEYRDGESDPYITRQYINGSLVKESETLDEGIKETLYRRGEAVLSRILEDEG